MNTGRCVDLELTHELLAQRPIGFGASTATLSQFRGKVLILHVLGYD